MGDKSSFLNSSATGAKSSKRLFGAIFVCIGGGLLTATGISAFFIPIADPSTAITCGTTILGFGAGLLGFGVLDGLGKTVNNKISGPPQIGG